MVLDVFGHVLTIFVVFFDGFGALVLLFGLFSEFLLVFLRFSEAHGLFAGRL